MFKSIFQWGSYLTLEIIPVQLVLGYNRALQVVEEDLKDILEERKDVNSALAISTSDFHCIQEASKVTNCISVNFRRKLNFPVREEVDASGTGQAP